MHIHLGLHAIRLIHAATPGSWSECSMVVASTVRHAVRDALEHQTLRLSPRHNRFLKYDCLHPALQPVLANAGIEVGPNPTFTLITSDKAILTSNGRTFVLRATPTALIVSEQRYPTVSRKLHALGESVTRVRYGLPAALRRRATGARISATKKLEEHCDKLRVNVGAGLWYASGWKNLDHSAAWYTYPRGVVDYEYDLTTFGRMPFANASVDLFYSEHVFEHFTNDCCRHIFRELRRSLKPGGGLRVVVPDADLLYTKLMERDEEFFATRMHGRYANLQEAFLILVAHPRTPFDEELFEQDRQSLSKCEFLDKCTRPMVYDYARAGEHINWFNFDKVDAMLHEAGFDEVQQSTAQSSVFPEIRGPQFDTRPSYSLHVDARLH
jgi:SAM-dependent methyltransferase